MCLLESYHSIIEVQLVDGNIEIHRRSLWQVPIRPAEATENYRGG